MIIFKDEKISLNLDEHGAKLESESPLAVNEFLKVLDDMKIITEFLNKDAQINFRVFWINKKGIPLPNPEQTIKKKEIRC